MPSPEAMPAPDDPRLALVLRANLALLELNDRLVDHWRAHARARDLTPGQAKILLALDDEAVPMRALARRLSFDASNLTGVIDRLEDRGLVAREPDAEDRRSRPVRLTANGRELRDAFWSELTHDPGPLAPLGESELQGLCATLAALDATVAGGA